VALAAAVVAQGGAMTVATPARRPLHWAGIGESTFVAGMWFLYAVHRVFGRLPFLAFLYPVVFYYWATRPLARRASLQYLRRMQARHGAIGRVPGWRQGLKHFLSFADTLLDKMLAASGRYRFDRLRVVGNEPLQAMIVRGQGALLVTAHVGCLELCQASADRHGGFKLTVLVHTAHAESFNRVLRRLQPHSGVTLMQVSEVTPATAVVLAEKVARGEFIAIAGDRVPLRPCDKTTTRAAFLGHDARWPIGPYVLAALLKVPLYSMLCVRERDGHALYFDALAERVELPRGRRAEAIAEHARRFAAQLESRLAEAPYDWFNFFPFWEQTDA
jgi:predicted LPLAT superfamily acyltransferase